MSWQSENRVSFILSFAFDLILKICQLFVCTGAGLGARRRAGAGLFIRRGALSLGKTRRFHTVVCLFKVTRFILFSVLGP